METVGPEPKPACQLLVYPVPTAFGPKYILVIPEHAPVPTQDEAGQFVYIAALLQ